MSGASSRVLSSDGPAETERIGASLAARLQGGDVVLVSGELGAGKSTLVRAAARALGVTEPMPSPTFTLGRLYAGRDVAVAHLDLYRLEDLGDEDPGLLDDYLGGDRIAFVEWPARAGDELGPVRLRVHLEHAGGDRRRIEVREG